MAAGVEFKLQLLNILLHSIAPGNHQQRIAPLITIWDDKELSSLILLLLLLICFAELRFSWDLRITRDPLKEEREKEREREAEELLVWWYWQGLWSVVLGGGYCGRRSISDKLVIKSGRRCTSACKLI